MNYPAYLLHYASPYYDPEKAHEYYMKNRELKGDTTSANSSASTSTTKRKGTLNDKGKAAKAYVKNQIDQERDSKLAGEDEARKGRLEQNENERKSMLEKTAEERDKEISDYSNKVQKQVDGLIEKLKNMSPSAQAQYADQIRGMIGQMREANNAKKQELEKAYAAKSGQINSQFSSNSKQINTDSSGTKKQIRQESKDKYNAELDKIYSDSSMLKPAKQKKEKTKK